MDWENIIQIDCNYIIKTDKNYIASVVIDYQEGKGKTPSVTLNMCNTPDRATVFDYDSTIIVLHGLVKMGIYCEPELTEKPLDEEDILSLSLNYVMGRE